MDDQLSVPALQKGNGEKILPGKSPKAGRHRRTRRWYYHGARAFASAGLYVFLLLITTLSLFLVQSRMAEGVPSMLGYRVYLVPNSSTASEFDNGTMILLREADPAQIEAGDTIATGSLRSGALTFLYVARKETAGETFYTTRGSAGSSSLGSVSAANIAGKVDYAVPYIGYLLSFSQTRCGLLVLLLIPGTLVILVELLNIYKQAWFLNQHKSYSFKKGEQR
jgi:signal peptidase I